MTISGSPITELSPLAGPTPVPVFRRSGILRMPRNPKVIAGLLLLAPFALVSLIGRWITPYDPNRTDIQHWVRHVLVEGTGPGSNFPAVDYPLRRRPPPANWPAPPFSPKAAPSNFLPPTRPPCSLACPPPPPRPASPCWAASPAAT